MGENLQKRTAACLFALTVLLCVLFPYLPTIRVMYQDFLEERQSKREWELFALSAFSASSSAVGQEELADTAQGQLRLALPDGVSADEVSVTNDYLTQTLAIEVPGIDADYFSKNPIVGSSSYIDDISWQRDGDTGVIKIALNRVYEVEQNAADGACYFNFLTPQEVYDKVVVIDAGHGGRASGAARQGIYEKNIDLAIALELKAIFDENGGDIGVYYTRTDDSNPSFEQRVQLANKAGANLFLSIHNNATNSGRMTSTNGTQVMYDEESEQSKALAEILLDEVTDALGSREAGTGLVAGDSIYIIRSSEVPVALVEVGFMTNQDELDALNTEDYQKKAAEGIYSAILRAFDEGY